MDDTMETMDTGKEISPEEASLRYLTDSAFHDVKLQGSDGVVVGANRCALAARSRVFEKMLLGDFKESKEPVVKIGFQGRIVKAIVEYIHTNKTQIWVAIKKKNDRDLNPNDVENIRHLLSLQEAASYFNLTVLAEKAHESLRQSIKKVPSLSFAVAEVGKEDCNSLPEELEALAWTNIRSASKRVFTTGGASILSLPLLKDILQSDELLIDEHFLCRFVRFWVDKANSEQLDGHDRPSMEADLLKYIRLELIPPTKLTTDIASSGLFTQEQLFEAFKVQAMASFEQSNFSFKKCRRQLPVWDVSEKLVARGFGAWGRTYTVHKLEMSQPVKKGVHQWTMAVEKSCNSTAWLGVCSDNFYPSSWPGDECEDDDDDEEEGGGFGWFYGENGATYPMKDEGNHPKFGSVSVVSFIVNLRHGDAENGALYASVDGGPTFLLFCNLRKYLEDNLGDGLVPAVSLRGKSQVRLLDMQELEN